MPFKIKSIQSFDDIFLSSENSLDLVSSDRLSYFSLEFAKNCFACNLDIASAAFLAICLLGEVSKGFNLFMRSIIMYNETTKKLDYSQMEKKGRILAVDFGTKRIGLAISDENADIAQPFSVIKREGNKKDIEKIANIVQQYNICLIVVGVPYGDGGKLTKMGEKAHFFGELLKSSLNIDVAYVDETMTSFIAEEALISSGMRREKRKSVIDKVAACIILQDFLKRKA